MSFVFDCIMIYFVIKYVAYILFQVLEQLKADNASVCLSICQKFVEVFNKQRDVLFISSYVLNQLSSELTDQQRDLLRLTHIGSRASFIFYHTIIGTSHLFFIRLGRGMGSEINNPRSSMCMGV